MTSPSQEIQYHTVDLFGGAIQASLPTTFADVRYANRRTTLHFRSEKMKTDQTCSDIRQVPDNQEVYLDKNGFTSITVDILERVDAPTDDEALKVHLQDVVGDDDAADVKVWRTADAHFTKLPCVLPSILDPPSTESQCHLLTLSRFSPRTPCYTLLATCPPSSKQRGRPNEPDFVGVLLTLIRLEAKATDLVVTINVPHLEGQYAASDVEPEKGKLGVLMERAVGIREELMGSLEVRDWELFV